MTRAIYLENQDILKGVSFLATLDNRTCLHPDSEIKTIDGIKKIKDIEIGDFVLTHKNKYKKISDKMIQKKKRYLKIKLSNGNVLKATEDHKVLTNEGWVEIGSLEKGNKLWDIKEQN